MGSNLRKTIRLYFKIIRPKQWYKNILLFLAIIFSRNLDNSDLLITTILAFVVFCLLSGSVYIFNDIFDRKKDKFHPRKRQRPIASGEIGWKPAAIFGVILFILSFFIAIFIGFLFIMCMIAYVTIANTYSILIKNIVIIDAIVIAIGFVIRASAGAIAIDVPISPWLIISVFLMALILAFGKRINELVILGGEAVDHRKNLKVYTIPMVEQMMQISIATLIMAYSMYTFLATNQWMMLTIPFVIYGLLRYILLVHSNCNEGGDIDLIIKDAPSIINLIFWVIVVGTILYFYPEENPFLGG